MAGRKMQLIPPIHKQKGVLIMAYETEVLLKMLYQKVLEAESLDDIKKFLLTMLTEEQAAYVEKIAAQFSNK